MRLYGDMGNAPMYLLFSKEYFEKVIVLNNRFAFKLLHKQVD